MTTVDAFPEVQACEDNDKRYSTHELMAHAERITGVPHNGWHLDVAADAESHWAPRWYSAVEQPGSAGVNGLKQPWFIGEMLPPISTLNIWANVPFSDPEAWLEKAWREVEQATAWVDCPLLCMVLPSDRTDKPWWQELVEERRDGRDAEGIWDMRLTTHHLPGRIRYGHPGNPRAAGVGQPMFGTTLLVWRP